MNAAEPSPEIALLDLASQRARLEPGLTEAIERVLSHGRFVMGPEVFKLESRLATRCGAPHVVGCGSGTDALLLAFLALGLSPGDAVVVPSFTFAATAGVLALIGCVPVFADCDDETFNLDASSAEAALEQAASLGLSARAVVAVDLFGQPADYAELGRVAEAARVTLLADGAQSFGASLDGRPVGTLAPITTASFFPAKPLGCYGDGGAVFCEDPRHAAIMRSVRSHGEGATRYDHVRVGTNARLDTLQAAVLLEKLRIFDDELAAREAIANRYTDALRDHVRTPFVDARARSAWAQYTVRVDNRDAVARRMASAGVPTAVYYPTPLHRQPAYSSYPRVSDMKVTDELAGQVLSLPIHPYLTAEQQDRVIECLLASHRA